MIKFKKLNHSYAINFTCPKINNKYSLFSELHARVETKVETVKNQFFQDPHTHPK